MKILMLLIPFILLATGVNISVNKKTLYSGQELIITLSAEGENIKFPNIQEIEGNTIIGTSTSDNISIINGKMKETITKSYILYPKKSFTIPSFDVYINGKIYKTKPIKIQVLTPKQTKGDFELDINISKNNLYLGENAILKLTFIKKADAESIQIQRPYIKNFFLKEINSTEITKNKQDIIHYNFLIIPQKSGKYKVGPLIAKIGKLVKINTDNFIKIASLKYQNIYSNKLNINVKPIPKNSIFGDFNISIKSKNEIKANEPNNVTLKISGCGDFYSIEPFNLNIDNTTIYKRKPKLNLSIKNNKLCGVYTQTFSIIANNNYVIPSIKLKTFNGKIHTISTPKIYVKVKNPIKSENITYTKTSDNKLNLKFIILISLISLIVGIVIGILFLKAYNYLKNSEYTKIKKANEKELLNILKKYEENKKIKEIMQKIEENIYKNAKNKINKKEIIKIIKEIKK